MALIDRILHPFGLFRPQFPFKNGDQVEHIATHQLMIVESVKSCKDPKVWLVRCKWFDREQKVHRDDVFPHPELKPFDWYHPT